MPELDLLDLFVGRLSEAGVPYVVTGSVAATLYGEPRATHDVDLVVELSDEALESLARVFPESEFYLPPVEVLQIEARRDERGHFNIIHHSSGLKADLYLAGGDEMQSWALRAARRYQVGGLSVRVAPPEYVIVRKLEFYREGGSPKHLRDIRSMLRVSPELIDRALLDEWIDRRGLAEPWREVESV